MTTSSHASAPAFQLIIEALTRNCRSDGARS